MTPEELEEEFGNNARIVLSNVYDIALTYQTACAALGIETETIEKGILSLAKRYAGCLACRLSRAPRDVEAHAKPRPEV
jgi:hypothetical protein